MIFPAVLLGVVIGLLNAFRGSGWLEHQRYELPAVLLKWAIIPLALFFGATNFHAGYFQTIAIMLPYFFFMSTGTAPCMQAKINQSSNNNKRGWPLFVSLSDKFSRFMLKIPTGATELPNQYYRLWGFTYATLIGFVFTLPFIFTNYKFSLLLLFFGVTCRYVMWRKNEFLLLAIQSGMFFISILYM